MAAMTFGEGGAMAVEMKLKILVHYPAAEEPFKDDHASPTETVGQLKVRVLAAFGLVEETTPEGNIVTYVLYHEKMALEDPGQTLDSLAADKKVLQLKLAQQITQG